MATFVEQTIYCCACGKPYLASFHTGWIHAGAGARVCSRECHARMEQIYVRNIMGKPDEPPADAMIEQVLAVLNEAVLADPESLQRLFALRTTPTQRLVDHPTIQVQRERDATYTFSALGLINGLFGTGPDGWGKISSVWDDHGNLVRFDRTVHNHFTQAEFEQAYARRSGVAVEKLRQRMVAKRCACGETNCAGWRMASLTEDSRIDPATGQDLDAPRDGDEDPK